MRTIHETGLRRILLMPHLLVLFLAAPFASGENPRLEEFFSERLSGADYAALFFRSDYNKINRIDILGKENKYNVLQLIQARGFSLRKRKAVLIFLYENPVKVPSTGEVVDVVIDSDIYGAFERNGKNYFLLEKSILLDDLLVFIKRKAW